MSDYGRIAHEAYEEAAAQSGWETNPVSRVPWEDVPEENRAATTAAASAVVDAVLTRGTVSNPAWCRGYDAGLTIGIGIGRGRERTDIVVLLRKWAGAAKDAGEALVLDEDDIEYIEFGQHSQRGNDE